MNTTSVRSNFFDSIYHKDSTPKEYEDLFQKRAFVIKPGLERMNEAWELLGFPSRNIPCIHVAGTNGKGSTSAFAWMLLKQLGVSAGLYTSPHLFRFEERFLLKNGCVNKNDLMGVLALIRSKVTRSMWEELTFFEVTTLAGFILFEERKCESVVLEVGLGGRLDATNIITPTVSAITSIGMDHAEWLGNTTEKIAAEKAGIIKHDRPVVWGGVEQSDIASDQVIKSKCAQALSRLYSFGDQFQIIDDSAFFIQTRSGKKLTLNFPEALQSSNGFLKRNFCLAAQSVWIWSETISSSTAEDLRHKNIQGAINGLSLSVFNRPPSLVGRFMLCKVSKGSIVRSVCFDVCHNPHGAKALIEQLKQSFGEQIKLPVILSIFRDKDIVGIWDELSKIAKSVNLFQTESERTWEKGQNKVPGSMNVNFMEAFLALIDEQHLSGEKSDMISTPIVICGSVFGIGQAIKELALNEWKFHDW